MGGGGSSHTAKRATIAAGRKLRCGGVGYAAEGLAAVVALAMYNEITAQANGLHHDQFHQWRSPSVTIVSSNHIRMFGSTTVQQTVWYQLPMSESSHEEKMVELANGAAVGWSQNTTATSFALPPAEQRPPTVAAMLIICGEHLGRVANARLATFNVLGAVALSVVTRLHYQYYRHATNVCIRLTRSTVQNVRRTSALRHTNAGVIRPHHPSRLVLNRPAVHAQHIGRYRQAKENWLAIQAMAGENTGGAVAVTVTAGT